MEYSPEYLWWKLYWLYEFSKIKLFKRPFVILPITNTKEEIIEKLKISWFRDNQSVAIRFSSNNIMNLPFYLWKFTLDKIADTIMEQKLHCIPFVHGLVKSKFSASLYFDDGMFFIELWPWIWASKEYIFNENPDIIKMDDQIHIARYLIDRHVENIEWDIFDAPPFEFNFISKFTEKILQVKNKLSTLQRHQEPLICDICAESINDINFMWIQKSWFIDLKKLDNIIGHDFYIVKTIEDLEKYRWDKEIFFDIPLSREWNDWEEIINVLRRFPKVYVKSLTMHLSVILREFGVNVEKWVINDDYEIKVLPL